MKVLLVVVAVVLLGTGPTVTYLSLQRQDTLNHRICQLTKVNAKAARVALQAIVHGHRVIAMDPTLSPLNRKTRAAEAVILQQSVDRYLRVEAADCNTVLEAR